MDKDRLVHSLRGCLHRDGIKLWLEPYTKPDETKGEEPEELVDKYSNELKASREEIGEVLEQLRCHALEKLNAKKKLKQSGELLLKVKLSNKNVAEFSVTSSVSSSGRDLKRLISQQCGLPPESLKLICRGRILADDKSLGEQEVTVNSQVLTVCLQISGQSVADKETEQIEVERIREAAEILADKRDDRGGTESEYFLQIADQNGKPLKLPEDERRALALAMTLHEKARAFIKRKSYSLGLLLLMEADEKFRQCRSAILEAVDNYALLCLDIVWTYLCMRNVDNLPDAQHRLHKCQEGLDRSYGANMQRVASIKGSCGNESVLYVRLHLLQAIVDYHQHRVERAQLMLDQTRREIKSLTIDQALITQVSSLGFTDHEARVGLRACQGEVEAAVNHIIKRREEKEALRKKEKEERKKKKLARSLGRTAKGQWVDPDLYDSLSQMGFSRGAAAEALRQSNNDITQALQVLQEHPELLSLPDPVEQPSDEHIAQILSMGFDRQAAEDALRQFGDVQTALDNLLSALGTSVMPSSSRHSVELDEPDNHVRKSDEQIRREEEAVDAIKEDLPETEDDYLDLTLEEETRYLEEYSKLLSLSE